MRMSVGTGLKVVFPIGPMPFEFDLAFPVLKATGDQVAVLQLRRRRGLVRLRLAVVRSCARVHCKPTLAAERRGRTLVDQCSESTWMFA